MFDALSRPMLRIVEGVVAGNYRYGVEPRKGSPVLLALCIASYPVLVDTGMAGELDSADVRYSLTWW